MAPVGPIRSGEVRRWAGPRGVLSVGLALLCLLLTKTVGAAVISVPTDAPSIQMAVDLATNGDTVFVEPGTYQEKTQILGKSISLIGAGVEQTFISGLSLPDDGFPLLLLRDCDSTSIVTGFTFEDADNWAGYGGAIRYERFTDTRVTGNRFQNNHAYSGGAIDVEGPSYGEPPTAPRITGNHLEGNSAEVGGAVSVLGKVGAHVTSNVFVDNEGFYGSAIAIEFNWDVPARIAGNLIYANGPGLGAIYIGAKGYALIELNTLFGNIGGGSTAGIYMVGTIYGVVEVTIRNNIITGCNNGRAISLVPAGPSPVYLSCNNLWANPSGDYLNLQPGATDFSLDPQFCNPSAADFRLEADSPCAPGGACGLVGALDVGCAPTSHVDPVAPPTERPTLSVVRAGALNEMAIVLTNGGGATTGVLRILDVQGRVIVSKPQRIDQGRFEVSLRSLLGDRARLPGSLYLVTLTADGIRLSAKLSVKE
jgi:hypothetical protein